MSLQKAYAIRCEREACPSSTGYFFTSRLARKVARGRGWSRRKEFSSRLGCVAFVDVCPACVAKEKDHGHH